MLPVQGVPWTLGQGCTLCCHSHFYYTTYTYCILFGLSSVSCLSSSVRMFVKTDSQSALLIVTVSTRKHDPRVPGSCVLNKPRVAEAIPLKESNVLSRVCGGTEFPKPSGFPEWWGISYYSKEPLWITTESLLWTGLIDGLRTGPVTTKAQCRNTAPATHLQEGAGRKAGD